MYSPMPGPNGTVENRLNAESTEANQPAPAKPASTLPSETAKTVRAAGTSLPGSWNSRTTSPPVAREIFSASRGPAAPISGMVLGNVLAKLSLNFAASAAFAVSTAPASTMRRPRPIAYIRFIECPSFGLWRHTTVQGVFDWLSARAIRLWEGSGNDISQSTCGVQTRSRHAIEARYG